MAQVSSNRTQLINQLGIKDITRDGYLVMANEHGQTVGYANMLRIEGFSLTDLSTTKQIKRIISNFNMLLSDLLCDVKIISMPTLVLNHQQKTYWNHKLEQAKDYHSLKSQMLNDQIKRLGNVASVSNSRLFILMIFDKKLNNISHLSKKTLSNDTAPFDQIRPLSLLQKIDAVANFEHPSIFSKKSHQKFARTASVLQQKKQVLGKYQPPHFHIAYMFDPKNKEYYSFVDFERAGLNVKPFWLLLIMNKDYTISFLSFENMEINPSNSVFALTSNTGIANYNVYFRMSLHILVYAPTIEQLISRINKITASENVHYVQIKGHQGQKNNLKSMLTPITEQQKLTEMHIKIIQQPDLSAGYMCHQDQLTDPSGSYLGSTSIDDEFCFNPYLPHNSFMKRNFGTLNNHAYSLISGRSGMGKSTLAKMLCDDAYMRNESVFNIDFSGEYADYTKERHGKIIDPTKMKNSINMFQLFNVSADKNSQSALKTSYINNTIRIVAIYKYLCKMTPKATHLLFSELDKFYQKHYSSAFQPANAPTICDFSKFLEKDAQHYDKSDIDKLDEQTKHIMQVMPNAKEKTHLRGFDRHQVVDIAINADTLKFKSHLTPQDIRKQELYGDSTHAEMPQNLNKAIALNYITYIIAQHDTVQRSSQHTPYCYLNLDEANNYFQSNPETVALLADYLRDQRRAKLAVTFIIPSFKETQTCNNKTYQLNMNKLLSYIQYFHLFSSAYSDAKAFAELQHSRTDSLNISPDLFCCVSGLDKYQVLTVIQDDQAHRWTVSMPQYFQKILKHQNKMLDIKIFGHSLR